MRGRLTRKRSMVRVHSGLPFHFLLVTLYRCGILSATPSQQFPRLQFRPRPEGTMELSRRDLFSRCVALGVVKLGAGLTVATAFDSWLRAETIPRPATPIDQLGPFYKRGTPQSPGHSAVLRAQG